MMHVDSLPAVPTLPDAGLGALETARGNLPLEEISVQARITGLSAGVELAQTFRNGFDEPLEATYVFPLPDRAAVTGLRMEIGERVVEAELREREEARDAYDKAIKEGRRAAIAEEERPDVFTLRAGNIPAGERVVLLFTMIQPLPYEDGAATFRFPLVVAPRYIPGAPLPDRPVGDGTSPDTGAVPDASRITPPVLLPEFPHPVRLTLRAEIDPAGLTLRSVASSLHAIAEEPGADGTVVVEVRPDGDAGNARIDRDFILRLGYEPGQSSLTVTPDAEGDEATFALTVLPPDTSAAPRSRDVVLVLDRSGSMQGWKMVAARRAASRIVDTLRAQDRFAVLAFDTTVERPPGLGEGLTEATDRHRFRAVEHLARLESRGGTEMLRPLEEAARLLNGRSRDGSDRVLVLVTDGQVGNEDQILSRLAPALGGIRVHAVGIDRAVNAGFLTRIAALGRGRCELVESEDRLDEAMDHIHRRIGSPLVTGLALTGDGLETRPDTQAPSRTPDIYPGVPLTIYGRCRGQKGSITVGGDAADGTSWRRSVTAVSAPAAPAPVLWARAHLRDLEDRYVAGDAATPGLENDITRTSLRFGVLCRFTAFVAVDTEIATDGTRLHRVIQPVETPSGWDGMHAVAESAAIAPMAAMARPAAPAGGGGAFLRRAMGGAQSVTERPGGVLAGHIEAELTAITEAVGLDEAAKRAYLADLATRLEAAIGGLTGDVAPLERLIVRLRACDTADAPHGPDLDRLWQDTIDVLRGFTGGDRPAPRRRFWKR